MECIIASSGAVESSYRGGGRAINDLIAGHVKIGSLGSTPLIPHYRAGTLRLLAQTMERRSPNLPEIPTPCHPADFSRSRPGAGRRQQPAIRPFRT
jgi:hypothetical protein